MTFHRRVLIVAENASARFGGEAFLPLHYFRVLRARGIDAWLVTHARVRAELESEFATESDRIFYVEDTGFHRALWKTGARLPRRVNEATLGALLSSVTSLEQRRLVVRLVKQLGIDVVHQPIPVSPKAPSMMYNLGAPVVIGPLNGGMTYPPGMNHLEKRTEQALVDALRTAATGVNRLLPGKRRATTILVANERTRLALPRLPSSVRVVEIVENGIDFSRWTKPLREPHQGPLRLAFVGRLVDWKSVDLLLLALTRLPSEVDVRLDIFGDGQMRPALEAQCRELGLENRVVFHGFVSQRDVARQLSACDVLILPSLFECGGAVVLEAMALGLPVIASNWGGPADYLDSSCGILIPVDNKDAFVSALSDAISKLWKSPALRDELGAQAHKRAVEMFDWEKKVDRILEIYDEAIERFARRGLEPKIFVDVAGTQRPQAADTEGHRKRLD